ncbi:hypothetical protein [Citrobacter sp. Cf098]|uniref:hypothetical protein n=1 Tax=Citrobacter sp. Cf098 TaxID=2985060 RepID=UPI00257686D0|nr:hypothetical protein [Citrobacter sp. Cf098]MDM3181995.1 hypothetical protein [Citrobacter sp. Cf098]MDM3182363.1 hypothetical protein [Citrobacter sp. Cf098]
MSVQRYELEIYHCNGGEMIVSDTGDYVSHDDYAAIEAKCAALAAENASLNEKMNKLATWPGIEFYSSAWEFNNSDGNAALEFMCDVQTPSTDAFLAEVRAISLEDFADVMADSGHYDAANYATKQAHKIRQEAVQ